jgi:ATP-binding cassette, subfamily B, bacterial RamA/AmfB
VGVLRAAPIKRAWDQPVKQRRGWLPLIGLNALIGSGVTLVLPTVLGRSVDSIMAGADRTQWLIAGAGLIALGIAASIIDAFAGAACVAEITTWSRHRLVKQVGFTGQEGTRASANATDRAHVGLAAVTAIAAIAPPAGSLVLLAVIDLGLAAAFFGGMLLVLAVRWTFARRTADVGRAHQGAHDSMTGIRTITAAGTTAREGSRISGSMPELHLNGVVTWRILARPGAQRAIVCPVVAVLAVGGLQLIDGQIPAGELFAAAQYAVLGAGVANLTGVLGEIARARTGVHRAAGELSLEPLAVSIPAGRRADLAGGVGVQRNAPGRRDQFVA